MSKAVKIVLGMMVALVLIGVAGGAILVNAARGLVDNLIDPDLSNVNKAAGQIADFDLPEGYRAETAVDALGFSVISYNRGDGHSHLYLIQGSEDMSVDGLHAAVPGATDSKTRLVVVENRAVTIRGQAVNLVISEGTNSEGQAYREASAVFQGKGGPALVVIEEPLSIWDDARVDAFIESIR